MNDKKALALVLDVLVLTEELLLPLHEHVSLLLHVSLMLVANEELPMFFSPRFLMALTHIAALDGFS